MENSRRVVITGIGIWSCIGTNTSEVTKSLFEGRSGIGLDPERKEYGYHSALAGIIPMVDLKNMLDRRARSGFSLPAKYAYMASKEAFREAHIDKEFVDNKEVGIIFGNDSSANAVIESSKIMDLYHDTTMVGSGNVFMSMNSTVSMNLASVFGLRGVNFTISAACSSGSHSIGMAYLMIKNGIQDVILAGGAQETGKYAYYPFDAINAFSMREDDPQSASRPFDQYRDGLVPSGGAAALVLEEYEHAIERGSKIFAEIKGYGVSSNGFGGIHQPSVNGVSSAISNAIRDSSLTPEDIDYVNAHATSTVAGDMVEAIALANLFYGKHTWVSSTKSMTGHECWMAGASEIVYSILMMQSNFVAPNINFVTPDEYSKYLNIASQRVDIELKTVISNSFGFGGTNSSLVICKPDICD